MTQTDRIDGLTYGRLTIIQETQKRVNPCGKSKRMVLAKCSCGSTQEYQLGNLRSGNTVSCGCHRKEKTREHNDKYWPKQDWVIRGNEAHLDIGGKIVLIDIDDLPIARKHRWRINHAGYVVSGAKNMSLHRSILGLKYGDQREGDHINHNPLDNRRSQIRIATSSQNKMNRHRNRTRSGRYKGVHLDKERGKYVAQIKAGKHRFIGRFNTEIEAATAYDKEAIKHFGPFAYLNFPNKDNLECRQ